MNRHAHTDTSKATGGQAAERVGRCNAAKGSSVEGAIEALVG